MTPPAQIEMPLDARAAGLARRFLRDRLCEEHHASVEDEAELLVSELVGNGVRHGAPPIVLGVSCEGELGMQVSVRDGDPNPPSPRSADEGAESGRGFALVDLISDAWGVRPEDDGKAVWFRLDSSRA
ncbi:ATP-binding protein [Kineococcus sp. SYSU DK003]|uniref:ATP-binding protein n=1 Tax=Kineococcus sp. SYSU DK003 TaxID=3383124 RepID=UPI003D7CE462